MTAVDYPGTDTPDVTFSYTRLGRQYQITDGVGTRTFNYDDGDQQGEANMLHLIYEHIVGTNGFYTRAITRHCQGTGTGEVPGRDGGFHIGSELDPEYEVNYSYNDKTGPGLTLTGRFDRITGTGLPAYGVLYQYEPSSDLIAYTYFDTAGDELSAPAMAERLYEENRDLVYRVTNVVDQGELSRYTYVNDALGRRKGVTTDGWAFGSQAFNLWGYNPKSELEASRRYTGSYDPEPPSQDEITAERRLYNYDQIGNRQHVTVGNYTAPTLRYCADDLNRYNQTYTGDQQACPVASPAESFAYDDDGNLTQDGAFNYTWDAENRLVGMHTGDLASPQTNDKWLEFKYDYMGRRVEKTYKIYSGGWQVQSGYPQRFVYDGWNVVMVLNGNNDTVRKYTWGLDLSGSLHGAGGIGGLLAVDETQGAYQGTYWFFYDGNGNVGQLVKTVKDGQGNITGVESTLAAHYEYDPYGNVIHSSGPYADANPFRFSTKWHDVETGMYYYGYRYYLPRLGRWGGRDPIGERGGAALYVFTRNAPVNKLDVLGLLGIMITRMTPDSGLKKTECGSLSVEWRFDVNWWGCYAHDYVFLVQKVEIFADCIRCKNNECQKSKNKDPEKPTAGRKPRFVYYEAWRKAINPDQEDSTLTVGRDRALFGVSFDPNTPSGMQNCCGSYIQRGEVRGFCSFKGDPFDVTITAWENKVHKDRNTKVGRFKCGDRWVPGYQSSGTLGYHQGRLGWWDKNHGGPVFREASSAWNCCCNTDQDRKDGLTNKSTVWATP